MLNVTFCAYDEPDKIGGPAAWIQRLLPALRTRGIKTRCLFLLHRGETGPTLGFLRSKGFDCPAVACHDYTPDRIRWILERLQQGPLDIFVPNQVAAAYHAARWVRAASIPTVGVLHSDDDFHRGLLDEFVFGRREFRLSQLVCVSKALEAQVTNRKPVASGVSRIGCGVPVPEGRVKRLPSTLRVAYAGRLTEEQKRISELTSAFCRAAREVPGTEATLYGEGPDRASVERILATEGAGLPVRLRGRVDSNQIQDRLLECDVIALLSDYEGLPIALMEGMACGCVPVCLRIRSGIPELVEQEVTGLLVEDRAAGFVAAIRRLREDPGLWERLSRAARARIEAEHSTELSADEWADLLHRLHRDAPPRRPIRVPKSFALPPVNPALASADIRRVQPPFPARFYRRSRILAGRLRRQFLGQPLP